MKNIIEIKSGTITRNKQVIIENLFLSLQYGESLAIVGNSGSGKTSLLKVLGLIEQLSLGSYELFGKNSLGYNNLDKRNFFRKDIGFIHQDYGLIEDISIKENLENSIKYVRLPPKEKNILFLEAMHEVNLTVPISTIVNNLSGGEKQRISLAKLFLKKPKLILADEPTGSLDSANRDIVISTLLKLNTSSTGMIVVTHDKQVAKRLNSILKI